MYLWVNAVNIQTGNVTYSHTCINVVLFPLSPTHRDGRVKFFCLQVLEHHVRSRHASSSDDDILALRKLLMSWLQSRDREVDRNEVRR